LQSTDGYYERFLPSELLKVINIVDTPGTNVILERQQRLTEEFVPRADLILFVISADRPFTESEVTFLKYIAKWDKKVVYLLNKADILQPDEIAEVATFVQVRSFERGRVGNYNCFPSALPGLHRIRRNNFTGQLGARDGRRRGDRAARVRTRRTACQAARGGGTWCPSLKPLAVSPSLCLSLCLSRCVSLTVSLTVSLSLCLPHCGSHCGVSHCGSHYGVSLTVSRSLCLPLSPRYRRPRGPERFCAAAARWRRHRRRSCWQQTRSGAAAGSG
jgi:hypothetical protein